MFEAEKPTYAELKPALMSILKLNGEQWSKTLKRVAGAIERYTLVGVVCIFCVLR